MSMSTAITQKEDVDDVAPQLTDVIQYLQNTTIEDLSILISSLEVEEEVSKKVERSILDNNNLIINNKNNNNSSTRLIDIPVRLDTWNKFTNDYLHRKYPQQIPEELWQAEIDSAFLGVINTFKSQESKTTTSSTSLLFDGSLPREDRLRRLGIIAHQFGEQPNFPELELKQIQDIIKDKVGKDERTRKKYLECIKQYSTPIHNDYGYLKHYDISTFYNLIPRNYLLREDE